MKSNPTLVVIIPAYNEQMVLPESIKRISDILIDMINSRRISSNSYICVVDDGSIDHTWNIISDLAKSSSSGPGVVGIKFARNFGHQYALIAGLKTCPADIYITIDADLQDDENAIYEMVDHYLRGSHIVYGVRKSRTVDTLFKRLTALAFYKIMKICRTGTVYNHADYRLLSREVVEEVLKFRETNLFLRAIIPSIGFEQSIVYYDRKERFAGKTKYPVHAMLAFAWNGITSFSTIPLKFVSFVGTLIFLCTICGAMYSIYQKLCGNVVPGWTSTVLPIFFLGGVQLLCVGILGEYIGKMYGEVKNRPRYIIEKTMGETKSSVMPYK